MANQAKEAKEKLATSQKDAKETKQQVKYGQTTPIKPTLKSGPRGKCPAGTKRNPETGECESTEAGLRNK